jgi:hypothetical protein
MEKGKEYPRAKQGKSDAEQYWYSVVMSFGCGGHDALPQNVGHQARAQDRIKIQPTIVEKYPLLPRTRHQRRVTEPVGEKGRH